MSEKSDVSLDTIVALAKRRGFVFPTSTIYGGLANSYDYGPLGTELLRAIKNLWWREFISKRPDMVGLDSQIMLHPQTWVASGHVSAFNDPLVEDTISHKRYRADHLIEAWAEKNNANLDVASMNLQEMNEYIKAHKIVSPDGNPVTDAKAFNLLFETAIGAVSGEKSKVYLRGETAQGIFTNFKNIMDSSRVKLPFGVGQIGKSFRNEITTGQFVFRTFEFEQAEIEYFFDPEASDWQELLESWKTAMWNFVTKTLGIAEERLRWRQHSDSERSHYSKDTYDLEYLFPFGWKELWGVAYRTNFDLTQHMQLSGESLEVVDSQTGRKFVPHVIEPAVGVNRLFLMALVDAYREDPDKARVILQLNPELSPYQVAVFPLLKNKEELVSAAREVFMQLLQDFRTVWDDRGNIGKRYLSQDEAGTPFCVTVDFDTLTDNSVTIRHRDTAEQIRMPIAELPQYLREHLA
ncbi:glycine--tRNA ligase [Candidatus Woesebacteria bacterium]|nr:glycine--tRNA ligase [Candidatus Woesebacteria bacterium]